MSSESQFSHPHDLDDDRNRPADQQQAIERPDPPDEAIAIGRQGVAISECRIVLEREFEISSIVELQRLRLVIAGPDVISAICAHIKASTVIVSGDDSRANMPISLVTRAVWRVAKTISAVITA